VPLAGFLTTFRLWPFVYLRRSILQFQEPEAVLEALRRVGFKEVGLERFTSGVALLYCATKPVTL
jgi:ubiquinone/menaquinone biosynthesis C-methylase UbiE